jgi:hypothetical protein
MNVVFEKDNVNDIYDYINKPLLIGAPPPKKNDHKFNKDAHTIHITKPNGDELNYIFFFEEDKYDEYITSFDYKPRIFYYVYYYKNSTNTKRNVIISPYIIKDSGNDLLATITYVNSSNYVILVHKMFFKVIIFATLFRFFKNKTYSRIQLGGVTMDIDTLEIVTEEEEEEEVEINEDQKVEIINNYFTDERIQIAKSILYETFFHDLIGVGHENKTELHVASNNFINHLWECTQDPTPYFDNIKNNSITSIIKLDKNREEIYLCYDWIIHIHYNSIEPQIKKDGEVYIFLNLEDMKLYIGEDNSGLNAVGIMHYDNTVNEQHIFLFKVSNDEQHIAHFLFWRAARVRQGIVPNVNNNVVDYGNRQFIPYLYDPVDLFIVNPSYFDNTYYDLLQSKVPNPDKLQLGGNAAFNEQKDNPLHYIAFVVKISRILYYRWSLRDNKTLTAHILALDLFCTICLLMSLRWSDIIDSHDYMLLMLDCVVSFTLICIFDHIAKSTLRQNLIATGILLPYYHFLKICIY